ncbi:MAG: L,D-transpeptidase family protein, partial [Alphaproteobacteria bacterium]|nr:L,D-transpeptidase family protein [Alphaproteobacteria bacterium]
TNNPGDVMRLKRNLAKMNYYHPDKRSESTNDFHGYPNDALVNAIKRFQQDNGLPVTGTMARGGPTEAALNSKYEFRGARFEHPVNADKKQIAVFDGKSLTLYDGDKPVKSWSGNAGKLDFQSPEFQDVVGKGPLPVGMYVARQSEFYYFDDMTWVERRLAPLGLWTRFPGGRASWGSAKVSLEPSLQNDMRGRSGFTVHGGTTPGSKGCIDLEDNIDDFAEWFDKNGKDVVIQVKYD